MADFQVLFSKKHHEKSFIIIFWYEKKVTCRLSSLLEIDEAIIRLMSLKILKIVLSKEFFSEVNFWDLEKILIKIAFILSQI